MSIKTILGNPLESSIIEKNFNHSQLSEILPDATVLGFGWRNLKTSITDDNLGVRAYGTPDASDTLGIDLQNEGWDVTKLPPIEDDNGNLLDGRTRENEMKKLGEDWMPVVKVSLSEQTSPRAFGIILNKHQYAKRSDYNDFVSALVEDINDTIITRDKVEITKRLVNTYKANDFYGGGNGIITKITNEVYERTNEENNLVRIKSREEWEEWLGLDLKGQHIALLQVGGNRDEQFITRWVIPEGAKGRKAKVILYVNTPLESKAKEQVKEFIKSTDRMYRDMFKVVSNQFSGMNITPMNKGYELIGIIPQIRNDYQIDKYERKELVSVEEYMK
jgi:hypothetical protein